MLALCRPLVQKSSMTNRPFIALLFGVALVGCTQFPALDRTLTPELANADYPALVPLDPLLATATAGRIDTVQTQTQLQSRVERLRARAARLRGSVLTGREKQRLDEGLQ
tara:strand:+ start:719 stop:1048 length:330 start_codon:yes stop_codon:yes gene_type:complete